MFEMCKRGGLRSDVRMHMKCQTWMHMACFANAVGGTDTGGLLGLLTTSLATGLGTDPVSRE